MDTIAPGQIAGVDEKGRLTFPADVLSPVAWWHDETINVIVEACGAGRLRIFEARAVQPALVEMGAEADAEGGEAALIRRAVLADRYRKSALYKERRIYLVKEVALILGIPFKVKTQTYAQPFRHWIEVLSLDARRSRLEDHDTFPALDVDRLFTRG